MKHLKRHLLLRLFLLLISLTFPVASIHSAPLSEREERIFKETTQKTLHRCTVQEKYKIARILSHYKPDRRQKAAKIFSVIKKTTNERLTGEHIVNAVEAFVNFEEAYLEFDILFDIIKETKITAQNADNLSKDIKAISDCTIITFEKQKRAGTPLPLPLLFDLLKQTGMSRLNATTLSTSIEVLSNCALSASVQLRTRGLYLSPLLDTIKQTKLPHQKVDNLSKTLLLLSDLDLTDRFIMLESFKRVTEGITAEQGYYFDTLQTISEFHRRDLEHVLRYMKYWGFFDNSFSLLWRGTTLAFLKGHNLSRLSLISPEVKQKITLEMTPSERFNTLISIDKKYFNDNRKP